MLNMVVTGMVGFLLGVIVCMTGFEVWWQRRRTIAGTSPSYPPSPRPRPDMTNERLLMVPPKPHHARPLGPEKRGSQPVTPPKRYPPRLTETLEARRRQSRGDP